MRERFNSTEELGRMIMALDTAEERNLIVENKGLTKDYKAIWNIDKDELATVQTNDYTLVQHKEVFGPLINVLNKLNLKTIGTIRNFGSSVYVDINFKNPEFLIKDDATGIERGLRVINSFDGTNAIRGEVWGYRLVCSNGMKIPGFEQKVRQVHMGKIEIETLMESFVMQSINSSEKLKELVDNAMTESIEWKQTITLFNRLFEVEKHRNEMMRIMVNDYKGKKEKLTKWDIYNVITKYATHGSTKLLSTAVEEAIQIKAGQLLEKPIMNFIKE